MPADHDQIRADILADIKKAVAGKKLKSRVNLPRHWYNSLASALPVAFKNNLEQLRGEVKIVEDINELAAELSAIISKNQWNHIFCNEKFAENILKSSGFLPDPEDSLTVQTEAAITGCEYLIANTGSVVVSSAISGSRRAFVYPPVHMVIARESQIVENADQAYGLLLGNHADLPSMISIITGPSRTADIEKTLVIGAHGPVRLLVFIVRQEF